MRIAATAVIAGLVTASLSGCGGGSDSEGLPGSGSTAKVVVPSPTAKAAPSVQPFNAGGYLAANVKPTFPAGEPDQVAIVAVGNLHQDGMGSATLPVAYRNNTSDAISHVDLTATARLNGTLVATGQSQGATPAQVQPGEIGFAFIYFEDSKSLPAKGVDYQFTSDTMPADSSSYNTAPLTVGEATYNGSSIVGTAENKTGKDLTGPYDVSVYCFTGNRLTSEVESFADQDSDITAGSQVSFTADLYDTDCSKFAVGVSGYFK